MIWSQNNREKYILYAVILVAVAAGIVLSVFQIINRSRYRQLSENNRVRMIIEPAPRGRIVSSDGYDIAGTGNMLSLYLDVGIVGRDYQSLIQIAQIGSITVDSLSKLIRNAKRYGQSQVMLRSNTDMRAVSLIEENANLYPGILIKKTVFRVYPFNDMYSHPLGYVGNIKNRDYEYMSRDGYAFLDFTGQSGMEQYYDKFLRGINGLKYYEIDANGRTIRQINVENSRETVRGSDAYSSIIHDIQSLVDSLCSDIEIMEFMMMESQTGRVLSMLSKPSFNANIFIHGIRRDVWEFMRRSDHSPFVNRCIALPLMTGLVFRVSAIYEGLDNEIIDRETVFQPCTGSIIIGNKEFTCHSEHGQLGLIDAFINNCSIYFDQMNLKIGINNFLEFMHQINANGMTGIDCSGESQGFIPDKNYFEDRYGRSSWGNAEISECMAGRADGELTLIQMTVMLNTIVTGGKRIVPSLVDSIVSSSGEVVYRRNKIAESIEGFNKEAGTIVKEILKTNVSSDMTAIPGAKLDTEDAGALLYQYEDASGRHAVMFYYYPADNPEIIISCGVCNYENAVYRLPHMLRTIMKYYRKNHA